jgi:hypothetical protein
MADLIRPSKFYKCSQCSSYKATVIEVNNKLWCIECRFDDIGKDAIYDSLFSFGSMQDLPNELKSIYEKNKWDLYE